MTSDEISGKPLAAPRRTALLLGGIGSLAIALLHVVVTFLGPRAYVYFGAPRLAEMPEQFAWYPRVITAALAIVFFVWALYAFVGAGVLHRHLPVIHPALLVIGGIYTLRGLEIVPDLIRLARGDGNPIRQTVFSGVALTLGVLHLAGVLGAGAPLGYGAARKRRSGE